jgi:uncharacterized protein (DUF488 family)
MATLFTIGHSNHTLEEFINLLQTYDIKHLVDIRTIPQSRHVPWFNKDELSQALQAEGIHYSHLSKLGGLRHAHKDSINRAWRNLSFRGFADYMQTPEFYVGLKNLNEVIKENGKVVIMCAEAVPWRCHRSLIADAEVIRGNKVYHILSKTKIYPHTLTPFAIVDKSKRPMRIFYPKGHLPSRHSGT